MAASLKDRLIAFGFDYLVILGYLATLSITGFALRPIIMPLFTNSALTAQLTGFCLITLPVTLYFAIGESKNGTWGKARRHLQVLGPGRVRPTLARTLLRNIIKFIPWELSHFAIWHLNLPSPLPKGLMLNLFYVVYALVALYIAVALLTKRAPYDWLTATRVESGAP